jgi:ribosome recycling factor
MNFCSLTSLGYNTQMAYDFKGFDAKIKDIGAHLEKELSGIRTGRAAPTILDGIQVESYGTRMPINQVANISIEDARTLRIAPWDASQAKEIEKAIVQANLGISVGADEKGVRVFFPELTSERRVQLAKLAKERIEDAKTALRVARDDVWSDIQQQERDGEISEDDKFRFKDEMQKKVDAANKAFDDAFIRKEKEITG